MEGIKFSKKEEKGPDPLLEELWEKYEFVGVPPFKNSIAENRLKQACRDYANIVNVLSSTYLNKGDQENYVPPNKIIQKVSASDSKRREIHNQIALMVIGKQRSVINNTLAIHIADFALEYAESNP